MTGLPSMVIARMVVGSTAIPTTLGKRKNEMKKARTATMR
jgi:hypothetical protein